MTLTKGVDYKNLTEKVKHFFVQWGCCGIGPTINKVEYISFPANINENHCILIVFSVKVWEVMVLDPMNDEATYSEEEACMVLIPLLFYTS